MGKQINFYIEKEFEEKLIQQIFNEGFVIVAEDLDEKMLVTYDEFQKVNPKVYIMYLYKKNFGKLVIDKDCEFRLDSLRSPIIELTRTLIKNDKKIVTRGRLWVETKYYDENGEIILKDSILTKEYNSLVKWIKKNVPNQEVMKGEYIIKEYVTDYIRNLTDNGFKLI
nr:hypothetical protein [uncultured Clostridium sp.]